MRDNDVHDNDWCLTFYTLDELHDNITRGRYPIGETEDIELSCGKACVYWQCTPDHADCKAEIVHPELGRVGEEDFPEIEFPIDLHMVAMDETTYYNLDQIFEADDVKYVERIEALYLVDKNLGVHICSFESQPEMWQVECRPVFTAEAYEDDDISSRLQDAFDDANLRHDEEQVSYMGWESVEPFFKIPNGVEGDFKHYHFSPWEVMDLLTNYYNNSRRDQSEERPSRDSEFIDLVIEFHNQNSYI